MLVVPSGVGLSGLLSRYSIWVFHHMVRLFLFYAILCHDDNIVDDDKPLCVRYDIGVPIILLVESLLSSLRVP